MRRANRLCFSMKLATLVLTLSAVSSSASRADDASVRSLQFAQMTQSKPEHQPTGACTPIGLTANGDIVFPWECREIIEKQRGPVTVNVPVLPSDPPARDQPASLNARPEEAVAPPLPAQPMAATTGDHATSPPDADAALTAKPLSHRQRFSAVRHKDQTASTQPRPAVGAGVKVSNKDTSNKDKVALQRGAPQK
jgi:hypothetical protein